MSTASMSSNPFGQRGELNYQHINHRQILHENPHVQKNSNSYGRTVAEQTSFGQIGLNHFEIAGKFEAISINDQQQRDDSGSGNRSGGSVSGGSGPLGMSSGNRSQLSHDDLEYLNNLEQKLENSKNLTIKMKPFPDTSISEQNMNYNNNCNNNLSSQLDSFQGKIQGYSQQQQYIQSSGGSQQKYGIQQKYGEILSPTSNDQLSVVGLNINFSHFGCEAGGQDMDSTVKEPKLLKYNILSQQSSQNTKKIKWSNKDLVFERLSQTHKPQYLEVARLIKEMEEKKKCSFRPKVNQHGRRYQDPQQLFERLHLEKTFKDEDQVKREQIKLRKEVYGCTFKPLIYTTNYQSNKEIKGDHSTTFDRLYKDHEQQERNRRRKKLEIEQQLNADLTFKPQLQTQHFNPSHPAISNRFEHLYQDSSRRAESRRKIIEENQKISNFKTQQSQQQTFKRRSNSMQEPKNDQSTNQAQNQSSPSKPRYETLYENHRIIKNKKLQLEKKVFAQRGITFQPLSFRSNSISASQSARDSGTSKSNQTTVVFKKQQNNNSKSNVKNLKSKLPPKPK